MSLNTVDVSVLTVAGTSIGLDSASPTKAVSFAAGARQALIVVEGAPIYMRSDGDAATSADILFNVGDAIPMLGDNMNQVLDNLRFIRKTTTSATLKIIWYNREAVLTERIIRGAVRLVKEDGTAYGGITKTIQTELKAITAVAADVQSVSSTLDLSDQVKKVTIFIDHAKDHASASVGQGTEYVIQVSQKASGNDTWRALTPFTAVITAPTVITTDAEEASGQTVIEIGATTPVVGDILFFKHATIGSSEWATVIAIAAGTTCTLQDALTTTQAQGTYNTQGEHFVLTIDVGAITRLRVVCNNTKGSTNRAIVWRCAAITEA